MLVFYRDANEHTSNACLVNYNNVDRFLIKRVLVLAALTETKRDERCHTAAPRFKLIKSGHNVCLSFPTPTVINSMKWAY